ncbi:uncharacterized protein LOC121726813 isoform X2 [Aricia agestis]|uniref:uncharacterized protein LOC121726813 isoform X2 n=1 Tax=Aricia agestis TaxID=91739 RepID=UPI001C2069ED|nr:uncharacterized protein LOC121726813 isoform X2 [Aricia agestis]
MSGSDDTSDFNSMSPSSQASPPYNSPSQQVPQLANYIAGLSCAENMRREGPHLVILEEPMNHFRFRYKSEMIGTHGCLLGSSYATSRSKTHPTVELQNYKGKAEICCTLVRHDNDKEHPHKLQDDHDRDVSSIVPDQGSYKVAFSGMGIIHTAKKDVPAVLFKKKMKEPECQGMREEMLRMMCVDEAREINLNIVRLKFAAYDLAARMPICPPVFSQPISNLKSAATNDLRICRMSRTYGRVDGGDDVYLLVEKVKKTNIMVRLFELDENGYRVWTEKGKFLQTDVHHQYAIVFTTPAYKDRKISSDVDVFVELFRPSDGRTSEPRQFTYKAHPLYKQSKKRKANSYSSLESNNSIKSLSDIPATVSGLNIVNDPDKADIEATQPYFTIKIPAPEASPANENLIGDAMLYELAPESTVQQPFSSMLAPPKMSETPAFVDEFNSSEIARLLEPNPNITPEEKKMLMDVDLVEYISSFPSDFTDGMKYIKCALVGDSGRGKPKIQPEPTSSGESKENTVNVKLNDIPEYTAVYTSDDGKEVKKIVKEICEIIRNKVGKKQEVAAKLDRLFEMRLSNGDTFLHMSLCSNQPSLVYIVKLVHSVRMPRLLNLKNHDGQTLLHLAVMYDSKLVPFLVSKGCDPMLRDSKGNNAIHYAVRYQTCLEPLVQAINTNNVHCDLNTLNNDERSALHLAAQYGNASHVRTLLRAGAAPNFHAAARRTPLHLAALAASLPVVQALLDTDGVDIDAKDENGYTALLMACDAAENDASVDIVQLLLEKKADPMIRNNDNKPAWTLARNNPKTMAVLKKFITVPDLDDDDIKSGPEDDYESADDDEMYSNNIPELRMYLNELAPILDQNGGWRELAERVSHGSLLSWYDITSSPTMTLLNHIKSNDDGPTISSRSLALLLEDIGQKDAAAIVRKYVS